MEKYQGLNKEEFLSVCKELGLPNKVNPEFVFKVYSLCIDNIENISKTLKMPSLQINDRELILYIAHEHFYTISSSRIEDATYLENDEQYITRTASLSMDKLLTNEHLTYKNLSFANRFSPTISTLELFINYALKTFNSKFLRNQPDQTLLIDMLDKCFQLMKCDLLLLINGFETEAFSTWRTIHESECILKLLFENRAKLEPTYLKHIEYSMAMKGAFDKEKTDKIFIDIKSEMKKRDLKSKDIKKFIEYGWLYKITNGTSENLKLNFRDGVQKLAGLSDYSKVYEMSSEVTHSSPFLIYSRKNYFFIITLLNIYETFFRVEKIFTIIMSKTVSKQEFTSYKVMRDLYYSLLVSIYQIEKGKFDYTFSKNKEN